MKKRKKSNTPLKVIKTSLKSICLDTETILTINNYCKNLNQIVIHTYQFLRLYILHKYHTNQSLPKIDSKFIEHIIKTIANGDKRGKKLNNDELTFFYENHYKQTIQGDKLSYSKYGNTIGYTATSILTCFETNIKTHFTKHLKRFINIQFCNEVKKENQTKEERYTIYKNTKLVFDDIMNNTDKSDNEYKIWKDRNKLFLIPEKIKKNVYYDLECSPQNYIFPLIYMSLKLEEKEKKLFQFCPLRKTLIPKYMTIDTKTLITMLFDTKKHKTAQGKLLDNLNENKELIWNSLFNIEKINKLMNPNKYIFNHMFSTDGIGCSLVFIRTDMKDKEIQQNNYKIDKKQDEYDYINELSNEELNHLKDYNKVAIDPGKNTIMFMTDEKGNTLKYTKLQRRIDTYSKKKRQIIMKSFYENNIKQIEQPLNQTCSMSCNYDKFIEYLKVRNKINQELQQYYEKELFRKLRWRSHTYTQKSESILINKIKRTFGKKIVIGFGSFQQTQQMKNCMPTPNKGLKDLLSKHFKLCIVDEFKTSKICSFCLDGETSYYKQRENPRPFREGIVNIHGLLTCTKCSKSSHSHLMNRDLNGSRNILYIMKEWIQNKQRPSIFCRKPLIISQDE
jgi:hypothetical protein